MIDLPKKLTSDDMIITENGDILIPILNCKNEDERKYYAKLTREKLVKSYNLMNVIEQHISENNKLIEKQNKEIERIQKSMTDDIFGFNNDRYQHEIELYEGIAKIYKDENYMLNSIIKVANRE